MMRVKASILSFVIFMFGTSNLNADVPQELSYNGFLTNAIGEPVDCPDAVQCGNTFNLSFKLYTSPESDEEIWEEVHLAVPIFQGNFHLVLGSSSTLSAVEFNGPRWLAISVNGGAELSPRQKVTSAPYALRAERADQAGNSTHLGGMNASEYATQLALTQIESNLSPVATEGLPADLADGDNDTLGGLDCAEGMVPKATAEGTWECAVDVDTDTTIEDTDTDTTLSEADVNAYIATYVAVNGIATGPHTTDTDTQLSGAQVLAFVANSGYVAGEHTVDTNTQLSEADVNAYIANYLAVNGVVSGAHTVDTNTQLNEAEVDSFVSNNGYLTENPIPTGLISMWSGPSNTIPAGWALCDGNNGTPDLLDRFILSVPDPGTPPGTKGGSHISEFSHTHVFSGGTSSVGPSGCGACMNSTAGPNFAGGHSHSVSGTTETSIVDVDVRPRYYTLAFIMKL